MAGFGGVVWEQKLRTAFTLFDSDLDGKLRRSDIEAFADRATEKMNEVDGKRFRRKVLGAYDDIFGHLTNGGGMTQSEYFESIRRYGAENLAYVVVKVIGMLFDFMDHKGDGAISRSEYALVCHVFKLDPKVTDTSFNAIDVNKTGSIGFDDFVKAYVKFFTTSVKDEPTNLLLGPLKA